MANALLVFNAGSTSLKFAAYRIDASRRLSPNVCGSVDAMQTAPRFVVQESAGRQLATHDWAIGQPIDHDEALRHVVDWLHGHLSGTRIVAAGHRVMLGGLRFDAPVRIDDDVLAYQRRRQR